MKILLTKSEQATIQQTVLLEAEDQNFTGKLAVAYVIRNRMERGKLNAFQVCWAPWQFSCWLDPLDKIAKRFTRAPLEMINDSWTAVDLAFDGTVADPTLGATHYLNIEVTKQQRGGSLPQWVEQLEHTIKIGEHDFYKEK